jgi:ribonuclease HI
MKYKCSFCGRHNKDVESMVSSGPGSNINICSDCIKLAYEIVMGSKKGELVNNTLMTHITIPTTKNDASYKCYFDGTSERNSGEGTCRFVVLKAGQVTHKDTILLGAVSKDAAECHGVIALVDYLITQKAENIQIFGDSGMLIKQINGDCQVRAPELKPLIQSIKILLNKIPQWDLKWLPKEENIITDHFSQKDK